jgi:AcrR family transcriptional regulator
MAMPVPRSPSRRASQLKPGPGLPRTAVARHQRERLLIAVAECSLAGGYQAATIEGITARAGVSKKTFYEHFKSKDEIFLAAYQEAFEQLRSAVNRAFLSEERWPARVAAALGEFLGFLAANPAFAHLCIVEVHSAGRTALERRSNALEFFAEYFDLGRSENPERHVPALTAQTIVGGIHEVVYRQILEGRTRELPGLAPELVYNALLPYLGQERAREEYERLRGPGSS